MLSKVFSAANTGFSGQLVEIECDMSSGLPGITIVGLPNKAIDEAKDRVRSALKNSRLKLPPKRITLNLAPADLPKDGTAYDLAMAVAILAASEQVGKPDFLKSIFVGELALDGGIRPVPGVLGYVQTAKEHGFEQVFIPHGAKSETRLIEGITIYAVRDLRELYRHLVGENSLKAIKARHRLPERPASDYDFAHIYGQAQAKRGLEVAAAGGHNILLSGPPGTGKTMLARSLISILPVPGREEMIAITKLHSLGGTHRYKIIAERPFRSPHHTASDIALIGGGQTPKPGEISLAHHGVLFLDELPEFRRNVLEVLRQPLEDGIVTVARAKHSATYPAEFMLVATQNPCPCGYFGDEQRECSCSAGHIQRYQKKLSGPLLDRIDMVVNVGRVEHDKLLSAKHGELSSRIAVRVDAARQRQAERGGKINAHLNNQALKRAAPLNAAGQQVMRQAAMSLQLSARGYMRVLKVARTIADLEGAADIAPQHLAEALQYRLQR